MKEEDGVKSLGVFCSSADLCLPPSFFSPLPSPQPPHQHLKNHSHSCCVSAHAGRNCRGSAPDPLDNLKASLCVGTGGTAKFPRPPGEGEGEGRQRCWSQQRGGESSEQDERGTYISRGTMGVLLADCEKTH